MARIHVPLLTEHVTQDELTDRITNINNLGILTSEINSPLFGVGLIACWLLLLDKTDVCMTLPAPFHLLSTFFCSTLFLFRIE